MFVAALTIRARRLRGLEALAHDGSASVAASHHQNL
jgi:hypothetical protein